MCDSKTKTNLFQPLRAFPAVVKQRRKQFIWKRQSKYSYIYFNPYENWICCEKRTRVTLITKHEAWSLLEVTKNMWRDWEKISNFFMVTDLTCCELSCWIYLSHAAADHNDSWCTWFIKFDYVICCQVGECAVSLLTVSCILYCILEHNIQKYTVNNKIKYILPKYIKHIF